MSLLYLKGLEQFLSGDIALDTDTIKLTFMATSYTANAGTHQFFSDVSASRASGLTDRTLASKTVAIDTVNARVEFDAADVSEASVTGSTDKFVIWKDTATPSSSPLIYCGDIAEGTLSPISGTLSLAFNAEGIFAINSA